MSAGLLLIGRTVIFGLVLGGATWALGYVGRWFRVQSAGLRCVIGFSLLPVVLSYLGYTGLFLAAPWAVDLLGWACLAYAIYAAGTWLRQRHRAAVDAAPPVLPGPAGGKGAGSFRQWALVGAVPAVVVLALLACKAGYFTGSYNNSDDLRSFTLTSAFAANGLKPAFPFDFSIPISYSYYLYESSAFLYAIVGGQGYPAHPVLVVNLTVAGLFFVALWHVVRRLFGERASQAFPWVCLALTCYGLDFVEWATVWEEGHIEFWNLFQLTQMASYMIWTYQYLWGMALGLLALVIHHDALKKQSPHEFCLVAFLTALSAGYASITFVWVFVLLAIFTAPGLFQRQSRQFLRRWSIKAAGVGLVVLLPMLAVFLPRPAMVSWTFTPHWWFFRRPPVTDVGALWPQLRALFLELGPLLLIGMILGLVRAFRPPWRDPWHQLGAGLVLSGVGLTFTESYFFDWFTRGGLFLLTLISGLMIVHAGLRLRDRLRREHRRWLWVGAVLLLIPGAFNYGLEHVFRASDSLAPGKMERHLNQAVPLGVPVYSKNPYRYDSLAQAGRAMISRPVELTMYINATWWLQDVVGCHRMYVPCSRTRFGRSTPGDVYYVLKGQDLVLRRCLVQGPPPRAKRPTSTRREERKKTP